MSIDYVGICRDVVPLNMFTIELPPAWLLNWELFEQKYCIYKSKYELNSVEN